MAKSIKALYEDGVFEPLDKVRLKDRQRVKLTVVESESEKPSKRLSKSTAKRRPTSSRVDVAAHPAYRIVALFKSGVHDLSARHDNYLYR
jgi:predicted DNA-binding antitoxin AbrB/MazE fold protein